MGLRVSLESDSNEFPSDARIGAARQRAGEELGVHVAVPRLCAGQAVSSPGPSESTRDTPEHGEGADEHHTRPMNQRAAQITQPAGILTHSPRLRVIAAAPLTDDRPLAAAFRDRLSVDSALVATPRRSGVMS